MSVPRVPWHEERVTAPYAYIGKHPWCGEPDCERCSMVLKGQERLSQRKRAAQGDPLTSGDVER